MRYRGLGYRTRIWLLLGAVAALIGAAFAIPPFAQDPDFHNVADQRALWDIPNFADVISNAAFLIIGLLGLALLARRRHSPTFQRTADALPYTAFCIGLILTWHPTTRPCFGIAWL